MTLLNVLNEVGSNSAVTALIWTLFHSVWQSCLFAILAGLVIILTKNTTAVFRYNTLCILFISMLVTTALTFCYEYAVRDLQTGFLEAPLQLHSGTYPLDQLSGFSRGDLFFRGMATRIAGFISRYAGMITVVWLVVLFIKGAKGCFVLGYSNYILGHQSAASTVYWKQRLDGLCTQLAIRKPVMLVESALLKIPVVYGWFKPVIFIPLGILENLPPQQVEAMLLHELAHIRRNDYRFNLLQNVAEAIFFFNPALQWLSARIRREREHCCDDLAIAQMGNRKLYVEALISFKSLSCAKAFGGALAFTGVKSVLLSRVSRIVSKTNHTLDLVEKSALAGSCLALMFFFFFLYKAGPITAARAGPSIQMTTLDFPLGKVISDISGDLIKDGLINDKMDLCFELTNTRLVVNGVHQPRDVWEKLHSKYLKLSPYPIKPEYRSDAGFGIFFNAVTHILGIGTKPPDWDS